MDDNREDGRETSLQEFRDIARSVGAPTRTFDCLPPQFQQAMVDVGIWTPPQPGEHPSIAART